MPRDDEELQPPGEDLRNALTIARSWARPGLGSEAECRQAHADVARLIGAALQKLADPPPGVAALALAQLLSWERRALPWSGR